MQKLMDKTQDEVRQLPKPPSSDAQMELLHLISDFVRDVSRHLEGTPEETGLLQSIRPAEDKFKLAIRYTAPDFRAHEKPKLGVRFALPAGKAGSKDDGSDDLSSESDDRGEKSSPLSDTVFRRTGTTGSSLLGRALTPGEGRGDDTARLDDRVE